MTKKTLRFGIPVFILLGLSYGVFVFLSIPNDRAVLTYMAGSDASGSPKEKVFVATHIKTPEPVKAVYITSWVAGMSEQRDRIMALVDETEINAVVIDIKDYSGKLAFQIDNALVAEVGSAENRILDIRELIAELHEKNIYVIGRISVFQDPHYAQKYPGQAVQKASDRSVWRDRKGLSFVDPSSRAFWEYIVEVSKESYKNGFDELNYDYIRFPSDGDMNDIYYPLSEERLVADPPLGKPIIIENFFAYLHEKMGGKGAALSADLFGMTTTSLNDLNIGQVLERAAPYFDFIAPMVYPSHYPPSFIGIANPAAHPYEVVKYSMDEAARRLVAASSTPRKLRPWLQDFDLGTTYTADMVRAQKKAVYDAGLSSWMLWNSANTYTRGALD